LTTEKKYLSDICYQRSDKLRRQLTALRINMAVHFRMWGL